MCVCVWLGFRSEREPLPGTVEGLEPRGGRRDFWGKARVKGHKEGRKEGKKEIKREGVTRKMKEDITH